MVTIILISAAFIGAALIWSPALKRFFFLTTYVIPLAILAILHLCLLRYFPSTNLVDCADNCYTSLYFYFSSFSMFIQSRILKLVVICSCCSFLFLLSIFFILLFSTLLSIPCSVFSLCLFSLFSDLSYGFLFKSAILSFLFSYYSLLHFGARIKMPACLLNWPMINC